MDQDEAVTVVVATQTETLFQTKAEVEEQSRHVLQQGRRGGEVPRFLPWRYRALTATLAGQEPYLDRILFQERNVGSPRLTVEVAIAPLRSA